VGLVGVPGIAEGPFQGFPCRGNALLVVGLDLLVTRQPADQGRDLAPRGVGADLLATDHVFVAAERVGLFPDEGRHLDGVGGWEAIDAESVKLVL
jgi:hypothetical protein